MGYLSILINLLEIVLYVALPIFILSTLFLISVVKKCNYKIIKNSITNPIFPNIDLGFFKKIQREYMLIRKNKAPALINNISFYILILGFIALLLLVMTKEMIT